jgi:L-fuconolactonase
MRLDSHQHFWRYNPTDYIWMDDSMQVLRQDYLPEAIEPKLKSLQLDGTIAVQARQMLVETEWLLELAEQHDFIRGVVGWVDFAADDLDEQLERFAAHKSLKGVRELIHDMQDVDYATSDAHMSGISKLSQYDLTYDLLLKPPHIRPALELVRRFPDQPFVVDHIAKPDIAAGMQSPWEEDIKALARCENVCCKLSGMVTEAAWGEWKPANFRPYLDIILNAFGANRLMIGSDWPVCELSGPYAKVMEIVIDFTENLSSDEQDEILGGTCARFYKVA